MTKTYSPVKLPDFVTQALAANEPVTTPKPDTIVPPDPNAPKAVRRNQAARRLPPGASHWSKSYYTKIANRDGTESIKKVDVDNIVPVDKQGFLCGVLAQCPMCELPEWLAKGLATVPACAEHGISYVLTGTTRTTKAPLYERLLPEIPWARIWDAGQERFYVAGATASVGFLGYSADQAVMPWWGHLAQVGGEAAFIAATYPIVREALIRRGYRLGKLRKDDPEVGKGHRALIAKRARTALYTVIAAAGWIETADALGVTPFVFDDWRGWVLTTALAAVGIAGSRPYLNWVDRERAKPSPLPAETPAAQPEEPAESAIPGPDTEPQVENPGRAIAAAWAEFIAKTGTGTGLPHTKLLPETFGDVVGGWEITIEGQKPGAVAVDMFTGSDARTKLRTISQLFDVKPGALNFIEDDHSSRRVRMLVQPNPPLAEGRLWGGPDTIDVEKGRALSGRFADGTEMFEPFIKFGWGAPSKLVLGTTGSGKSENLRKQIIIERYFAVPDPQAPRGMRGLFATFLTDFKRYESYGDFVDALHAVGCTVEDAYIMRDALIREMERRYDFLASHRWTDRHGRPRKGGLKWDPRIHGPVLSWIIDEFHEIAGDSGFLAPLENLSRKMRACMIRITIGTHMGTLGDLGTRGLRDMLSGGYALLGRTTDSITGGVVTGGQLVGDPRTLPKKPGMCLVADGDEKTMMARQDWIPGDEDAEQLGGDVRSAYDWMFDKDNNPIGHPAVLPPETLAAFGAEWQQWAEAGRAPAGRPAVGPWNLKKREKVNVSGGAGGGEMHNGGDSATPGADAAESKGVESALREILFRATGPLDIDAIDERLTVYRNRGLKGTSTRNIRHVLDRLVKVDGWASKPSRGLYEISDAAREEIAAKMAEQMPELADALQRDLEARDDVADDEE